MNNYKEIEFSILRDYINIFHLLEPILHIHVDLIWLEEKQYSIGFQTGENIILNSHTNKDTIISISYYEHCTLQLDMAKVVIRCDAKSIGELIKILVN